MIVIGLSLAWNGSAWSQEAAGARAAAAVSFGGGS